MELLSAETSEWGGSMSEKEKRQASEAPARGSPHGALWSTSSALEFVSFGSKELGFPPSALVTPWWWASLG